MVYFKDDNENCYAYEKESQAKDGLTRITESEAIEISEKKTKELEGSNF